MSCQKLRQCFQVVILIVAVGCTVSTGHPIALATATGSSLPTQLQAVTPNPTPTSVEASSFEECIATSNSRLDGTYPPQCITENGVVFHQTLDEGITYSKTYSTQADRPGIFITSTSDGGHLIA